MQIAQDFLSRAPAENPAHSGLCKGFSTGTIGRKDKQDAQVIFEQFLREGEDPDMFLAIDLKFFSSVCHSGFVCDHCCSDYGTEEQKYCG